MGKSIITSYLQFFHLAAAALLLCSGSGSVIMIDSATAGSWCVATQSVSQTTLQVALDYACGHGGADCSAIQPGGNCFEPVNVRDHASYAFNSYYQRNPIPATCAFGGSALTTSTDPSYGTCQYPSTSTSSSMLNTSNSSGSRVFGAGPMTPSTSSAAMQTTATQLCILLTIFILTYRLFFG
ncbi:hypothetical protein CASFOL_024516 [Castilleja foliolosa]|uniref:X8 domain-containing protein n=1 Tax=Castilleja foliolosa TaxID=1961234 RepID=A0ABD3CSH0_9LAMI